MAHKIARLSHVMTELQLNDAPGKVLVDLRIMDIWLSAISDIALKQCPKLQNTVQEDMYTISPDGVLTLSTVINKVPLSMPVLAEFWAYSE